MAFFEIDIADARKIIIVIHEKYYFDLSDYSIISLKRRFEKVMQHFNLKNAETLIERLSDDKGFIEDFLSSISVESTEMFRDPSFWSYLQKDFFPSELAKNKKIKIYVPFSVSGDELYSLCLLIKESGWQENFEITTSCISNKLIENIKSGFFRTNKIEVSKENYKAINENYMLSDYLSTQNDCVFRHPRLIEDVIFLNQRLDLPDSLHDFNMVLFRNKMIYYNIYLQEKIMYYLYEKLVSGGFLFIGIKEITGQNSGDKFKVIHPEENIYIKLG